MERVLGAEGSWSRGVQFVAGRRHAGWARELWRADWAARVSIIGVVADTKRPAPARRTGRGQATVPKDDVSELGYGTVTLKTGAF